MKLSIVTVLAAAGFAGMAMPAHACNPMLSPNYGKHVAPTVLPASMLARNQPAARTGAPTIVGLWHDMHYASDGTLFLEGFDTWNRTGTENELGNLPPAAGNLCVGVWKVAGKHIKLTAHVAWVYDTSNNYMGTLDFTENNVVSADGNTYSGTFDARFFDPTGNLVNEVKGTTTADRIVEE